MLEHLNYLLDEYFFCVSSLFTVVFFSCLVGGVV